MATFTLWPAQKSITADSSCAVKQRLRACKVNRNYNNLCIAGRRRHLYVSVRPIVHCSWIVLSLNYRENQVEAIFESTSLEPTVTLRSGFQLGAHETQMKCHFQINLHSESSWWIQTWQQSHQIFSAHLKVNSASSSQWELTSHQVPVLWWRGHRDNLRFFPECE